MKEVTLASPDFRQMDPKGGRLLILSGVAAMDKEEFEETKSPIGEEGLGNETPWQRRMREAKQRDYKITRVLSSVVLLGKPILLIAFVVGGIIMYSAFGWFATILWVAIIIALIVLC
jgi:hypothetical protein